ncbi:1-aminocyclopropane-1-carboxylate deaminase [Brevibacterium sp.]|uniref:1-aminocyclopropane-1-carboxylate deaminase n=1 Tax=Brevibacterium sp. TaxID=1701 RepID=UPI002647A440|nr:1-aminocyclopropane-1-carboxylate deaminase [Brevibacterium sp.]MDN5834646.1 1-aminocyclopropane-1-carboxylate deaminase [Brevibacterium sp.]MDN6134715.1 1-aminocyclopropane-1-carboxylate deaminase [Brevibacterium sp.]MDN6159232.1 1-aminocyclopropane-1-carboxylate deaminase [Brevibacterium sp.]MDN6187467.1 1-aminocyclopropane-1-carboxylate deaminase [Brevibacterium sp.]MDN6604757.1 1-aminocyclopropane-1-carboxylate deaminase [Brevibacterium sp.]
MAITDFERYPLTFGPSPVHELKRLSDRLGGAQVWAKREDVNSGLAFGGNKTRKLEYIVPDILASGADTLVSIGGYQSNHTRQVAAVAAHLGLKSRLVQERWVDWDDPVNDKVGNIELSRIMGADVHLDSAGFDIGIRSSWENAIAEVEAAGGKPYPIPAGASEHRFGALGFVNWAYEVAAQEKDLGVFFDTIVVCTVTGSTHAGMIAGFAALEAAGGPKRKVIGIDASATLDKPRAQARRIADHAADLIGLGREITDDEVDIRPGWEGPAYGIPDESTVNAIRTTAELEGVILDPVYEGKSMAGLLDLVGQPGGGGRAGGGGQGAIAKDSTVLYAHLGGQLALNAYSSIF